MTPKLFSELGLSPEILKAIDGLGFEQASPIQAEAIPLLLAGHDVVGQSQTGSGKTAAFAVPAIEKCDPALRATQVLILCPTRELAIQVAEEVHKLCQYKRGLHALPVYGGQSYDRQLAGLRQGAHIVIGTPGRVMDHMRRATLKLASLKMIILDEVDVMLNMGFREDIELILQAAPPTRQTVFFSATIPRVIQQMIDKHAREPKHARIEQKAMTVPTVEQVYYEVDRRFKVDLLTRLIDLHDLKLGIIFCNTKRMVDDLVDHLNAQGYSADRLHGDMTQMMRDRVMQKFRKSGLDFLVATDVAARGIDVDDVEVVFNYDLPYDGEDYVHRIGRTGRKGRSGRAISFASGREIFQIRNIERYANTRIQRGRPPTAGEVEEARALVFLDKLRTTLQSGDFKKHDHLVERLLEEGFASTDIVSALMHMLQGGEGNPPPRREERPEPQRYGRDQERGRGPAPERRGYAEREPRPMREPRRAEAPRPAPAPRQEAPPPPPAPAPAPVAPPSAPVAVPPPPAPVAAAPAAAPVEPPPAPKRQFVDKPKPAAAAPKPVAPRPKPAAPAPAPAVPHPPVTSLDPAPAPRPVEKKAPPVSAAPPTAAALEPAAPKPRRPASQPFQKRLWVNVGSEMGVEAADVITAIAGNTGLPADIISNVDVRERHLFVDVADEHAQRIIARLNRAEIKGKKIKIKAA